MSSCTHAAAAGSRPHDVCAAQSCRVVQLRACLTSTDTRGHCEPDTSARLACMLALAYARSRRDKKKTKKKTLSMTLPFPSDTIVNPVNNGRENSQLSPLLRVMGTGLTGQSLSRRCFASSQTVVGYRKKCRMGLTWSPTLWGGHVFAQQTGSLLSSFFFFFTPKLLDEAAALLHCFSSAILSLTITLSRWGSWKGETYESKSIWV